MASLGQGSRDIIHGMTDIWLFATGVAAQICTSCTEYFPTLKGSFPWAERATILLGVLLLAYVPLRSYWRSVGKKWEFFTYFLILLCLAGAVKGYGVIDDVFKARFKSPELGNTVIEARSLHRKLNEGNLEQLDKTLMALGFTPPAMNSVGNNAESSTHFAFGRYQNVDVTISRISKGMEAG